jgi:putative membrane protein
MKRLRQVLFSATAISLVAFGTTQVRIANDGRANKVPVPRSGITQQDLTFLQDASVANMFEIATSKAALAQASSPWAKEFAKEMIDEHTSAQNELGLIAKNGNVTLPTGLPADKQAIVAKLQKTPSGSFDDAYRTVQIDGHRQTSAKFDKEVKSGHDSAARNYAIKILPAVRMHLKLATLRKTMMGETKIQTNQ